MLRGWLGFKGPKRAYEGLGGSLRVSESPRKPQSKLQGVGKPSERFGCRLRGAEMASLGLEDGLNNQKKSPHVLQNIGPFRAAARYCTIKNDKSTMHRYAMNT